MMHIKRADNAADFARRAQPFLVRREAENNLVLGLSASAQDFTDSPYLAYVEDGGEVVAAALRTPPRGLVLSAMQQTAALDVIAQDVYALYGELPDVNGPKPLSQAFADCWQALTGKRYQLEISMRIYQLEQVIPVMGVRGEPRRGGEQDRDLISEWLYAFQIEALGDTNRDSLEEIVNRWLHVPTRTILFWYVDGKPVSMAGSTGPTPHGIRIGAVYTPPEQRKRGYASACVAHLSQSMLDSGYRYCFLYTDLSNPTSNHIYQQIGYVPVCDVDQYRFE
jgi:predicted GNAT family acetyltransferase